jgi:hypothetical protein
MGAKVPRPELGDAAFKPASLRSTWVPILNISYIHTCRAQDRINGDCVAITLLDTGLFSKV